MYQNIKSNVSMHSEPSAFSPCLSDVRQVKNLSPFLLFVYLNDVREFLLTSNY